MMSYGELLRICRKRAGFTQFELANRAYTNQGLVSAYETGRQTPKIDIYSDLLAACGYELGIREKKDTVTIEEMMKFMEEHR